MTLYIYIYIYSIICYIVYLQKPNTNHQVVTEAVCARAFTKGHKASLDTNTDSKIPGNATQVDDPVVSC